MSRATNVCCTFRSHRRRLLSVPSASGDATAAASSAATVAGRLTLIPGVGPSRAGHRRGFAKEAGDALQPPVRRKGADVDTGDDHGAVRTHQVPGEAKLVVVRVDTAAPAEAMAWEFGLHLCHHLREGCVPLSLEHRIDVVAIASPGLLDELSAALRVGLVPHRQVRVDGHRGVSYVEPPRLVVNCIDNPRREVDASELRAR